MSDKQRTQKRPSNKATAPKPVETVPDVSEVVETVIEPSSRKRSEKRSEEKTSKRRTRPSEEVERSSAPLESERYAPSKEGESSKRRRKREELPEVVEEVPLPQSLPEAEDISSSRSRKLSSNRQELETQFNAFIATLEDELTQSRNNKNRVVMVKTWRNMLNDVKKLKTTSLKNMKNPKKRNSESGFMKPQEITQQMADFAGWDASELKSRVDATKHIYAYIKEKDLQNPENRREIHLDDTLKTLLKFDANKEGIITYPAIQGFIGHLFKKKTDDKE
jgi:hypothetical protein